MSEAPTTRDWSVRLEAYGSAVEGIDDIEQSLGIILCSPPGCDPLRPEFAADIVGLIDRPINQIQGEVIRRATAAITRWEQRIILKGVTIEPGAAEDPTWLTIFTDYVLKDDPTEGLRRVAVPISRSGA